MGYEIKLYIGEVAQYESESPRYLMTIATLDLCKPGYDSEIYGLSQQGLGEPVYFYGSDSNTKIEEDPYGTELRAVDIDKVIAALREDAKGGYRRFVIGLRLLRSIKRLFDDPKVVMFGH